MSYTIQFYNDMGHLMIDNLSTLPENIRTFAFDKIKNKINYAKDNKNLGCRFYVLRAGLDNKWTYNFANTSVTLDFSKLDNFNPKTMIYI